MQQTRVWPRNTARAVVTDIDHPYRRRAISGQHRRSRHAADGGLFGPLDQKRGRLILPEGAFELQTSLVDLVAEPQANTF
jgi:hypothetical protein